MKALKEEGREVETGCCAFGGSLMALGASLMAQLVENPPAMQEILLDSGSGGSTGEGIGYPLQYSWASLVAQLVKNSPAMQETWI